MRTRRHYSWAISESVPGGDPLVTEEKYGSDTTRVDVSLRPVDRDPGADAAAPLRNRPPAKPRARRGSPAARTEKRKQDACALFDREGIEKILARS